MFIINKQDSVLYNIESMIQTVLGFENGWYEVSIKRLRKGKSMKQRGWLWGAIYPMLLKALVNEGWELTSVEQVHEFFKKLFALERVINRHTGEVIEIPNSTALMNTVEYATYCEKLREYALEYLNIDIGDPDPNWKQHEAAFESNS